MTVQIYLKDSVRHYFLNLHREGKINKTTVIGSAILNMLMAQPITLDTHFEFRKGNVLDKSITTLHFHTNIQVTEQQTISLAQIIEKAFLHDLRNFAELYKSIDKTLSYRDIVRMFFVRHQIPAECLFDELHFESYIKVRKWREAKNQTETIQIS
jgi:tRNA splicing ligase